MSFQKRRFSDSTTVDILDYKSHFECLPNEIMAMIMKELGLRQMLMLELCSTRFREIVSNELESTKRLRTFEFSECTTDDVIRGLRNVLVKRIGKKLEFFDFGARLNGRLVRSSGFVKQFAKNCPNMVDVSWFDPNKLQHNYALEVKSVSNIRTVFTKWPNAKKTTDLYKSCPRLEHLVADLTKFHDIDGLTDYFVQALDCKLKSISLRMVTFSEAEVMTPSLVELCKALPTLQFISLTFCFQNFSQERLINLINEVPLVKLAVYAIGVQFDQLNKDIASRINEVYIPCVAQTFLDYDAICSKLPNLETIKMRHPNSGMFRSLTNSFPPKLKNLLVRRCFCYETDHYSVLSKLTGMLNVHGRNFNIIELNCGQFFENEALVKAIATNCTSLKELRLHADCHCEHFLRAKKGGKEKFENAMKFILSNVHVLKRFFVRPEFKDLFQILRDLKKEMKLTMMTLERKKI